MGLANLALNLRKGVGVGYGAALSLALTAWALALAAFLTFFLPKPPQMDDMALGFAWGLTMPLAALLAATFSVVAIAIRWRSSMLRDQK